MDADKYRLLEYKRDPVKMLELRRLLQEREHTYQVSRMTDEQVLRYFVASPLPDPKGYADEGVMGGGGSAPPPPSAEAPPSEVPFTEPVEEPPVMPPPPPPRAAQPPPEPEPELPPTLNRLQDGRSAVGVSH